MHKATFDMIRDMKMRRDNRRNVFFCKQKTAYEMRISDWSSDVCSSDLRRLDHLLAGELDRRVDRLQPVERQRIGREHPSVRAEIGRASCRERVCQYV